MDKQHFENNLPSLAFVCIGNYFIFWLITPEHGIEGIVYCTCECVCLYVLCTCDVIVSCLCISKLETCH